MFVLLFLVLPIILATAHGGRKIEARSLLGNKDYDGKYLLYRWPLKQAEYEGN